VLVSLALVLLAAGLSASAAERHPSLPAPGTTEGLGVNIHFTDPKPGEMEMLAAGGFRWVRMDFTWGGTERERGKHDFAAYERLLAALEPHGIRALFILDYSNRLYEKDRSVVTGEGRRAFAQWAAAAAKRFQGRGVVWEIWNEPNIDKFWAPQPDVDQYAALAIAAARAIREAAPGEAIVGPATSAVDFEFLEGCFDAGLLEWWDAVSIHPYRQSAPETAAQDYQRLRKLIDQHSPPGKTVPILSGEWGYSAVWKNFDEEKQGKMLARQWLINLANQIPLSIWYDWHDDGPDPREAEHHFGSVAFEYHSGRTPVYDPKPAYQAAQTLTTQLREYRFAKRINVDNPDDYVLLFHRGDELRLAAWTTGEAHEIHIPSDECAFDVVSHIGQPRESVFARDDRLTLQVADAPLYMTAKTRNLKLASAPSAP
jgi:hypothetical protein